MNKLLIAVLLLMTGCATISKPPVDPGPQATPQEREAYRQAVQARNDKIDQEAAAVTQAGSAFPGIGALAALLAANIMAARKTPI